MSNQLAITICCLAILIIAQRAPAQIRQPEKSDNPHATVIERLRSQPVGGVTLRELCPADEFLGRVADRIIRMDYQQRFRAVAQRPAPDTLDSTSGTPVSTPPTPDSATAPSEAAPDRSNIGLTIFIVIVVALFIGAVLLKHLGRKAAP